MPSSYVAKPATLDVSNANTPGVIDPGNGDLGPYYRVVAQLDRWGHFTFTETNAYSGDNGRAAITNDENGQDLIYAAGNAGQSNKPVSGVILGAGAQFIIPSLLPEAAQAPGQPTPLGSFNITELGNAPDKSSKDNNYRAIAIHDNVIYYTKGSGGNGINTVYFVDTTGQACPKGVGLPEPGAQLPTSPPTFTVSDHGGPLPTNMCILKGFPTNLATSTTMPTPGCTPTPPQRRSPPPGSRSGCSRRARGTSPTRCNAGWSLAGRTRCPVTRRATTPRRGCLGHPPPMAYGR